MSEKRPSCPLSRTQVVDLYFLEHRAKLLDIAAFVDRVARAQPEEAAGDDFRMGALRRAGAILQDDQPEKARRVLEVFSDHTTEPIPSAAHMKGAHGACPGEALSS